MYMNQTKRTLTVIPCVSVCPGEVGLFSEFVGASFEDVYLSVPQPLQLSSLALVEVRLFFLQHLLSSISISTSAVSEAH